MYKYFFSLIAIFILFTQETNAYIDPGTGSLVFQMVIGAILGFFFIIKLYFRKIKNFFVRIFKKNKDEVSK